ncbi:WbqC family protein [Halomonas sp. ISL-106]|nr:WbqC family protein [Halomonas sp. ISL-106]MBT2796320.1 WbqC family protein [Halomonas sp. ISL-104]
MVDDFVIYDSVQYTKNDWRNRNKIKTSGGLTWLTVPVKHKTLDQSIFDTLVADSMWQKKHWKTISQNYSKAPYFKEYKDLFEDFYLNNKKTNLSCINFELINIVSSILSIETKFHLSSDFHLEGNQTETLLNICQQIGCDTYLSGPAAKNYFDGKLAQEKGISIEWMDYSGYPEYSQLYPPFEHGVSILDLIFNEGPNARDFMKSIN